ncbi:hypothetical protein EM4838_09535 [Enterococcus mundtii]|nr:hypothetical protein EM4838_09535 [Enterococcus mundtii]OJG61351.1 hypothetical protein RV08_GL000294 [Enterococcus mundtii]PTO43096.1 hypothetical protein C6P50_01310 [Enterococcus mundtii]RYT02833.1 hypothetical protein EAI87_11035 [Enterococcus mundtii]
MCTSLPSQNRYAKKEILHAESIGLIQLENQLISGRTNAMISMENKKSMKLNPRTISLTETFGLRSY